MSTEFTTSPAGYQMADSQSLRLTFALDRFQQWIIGHLVGALAEDGFGDMTAARLGFLGALDCGENHASAVARRLQITRQAVHKTVHELERLGWLTTRPDTRRQNQRVIVFTPEGERLIARARWHFARLDDQLNWHFSDLEQTIAALENPPE